MTKKSNDRSLILYTSMIFLVAIVMIIVSFFAQTHFDRSKVTEEDAEKVSLSNKAAQVSEENMQLVELNKNLKESNEALKNEIEELKIENEQLVAQKDAANALNEAAEKLLRGNMQSARTILQNIYADNLSDKQKAFYDMLIKKTE